MGNTVAWKSQIFQAYSRQPKGTKGLRSSSQSGEFRWLHFEVRCNMVKSKYENCPLFCQDFPTLSFIESSKCTQDVIWVKMPGTLGFQDLKIIKSQCVTWFSYWLPKKDISHWHYGMLCTHSDRYSFIILDGTKIYTVYIPCNLLAYWRSATFVIIFTSLRKNAWKYFYCNFKFSCLVGQRVMIVKTSVRMVSMPMYHRSCNHLSSVLQMHLICLQRGCFW